MLVHLRNRPPISQFGAQSIFKIQLFKCKYAFLDFWFWIFVKVKYFIFSNMCCWVECGWWMASFECDKKRLQMSWTDKFTQNIILLTFTQQQNVQILFTFSSDTLTTETTKLAFSRCTNYGPAEKVYLIWPAALQLMGKLMCCHCGWCPLLEYNLKHFN